MTSGTDTSPKAKKSKTLARNNVKSPEATPRRSPEEVAKLATTLQKDQPAIDKKPEPVSAEPIKFEAMTFKCSPKMADILLTEGNKVGGVRVVIARFLKEAGHDIPEEDLSKREVRRTDRRQRR